MMLYMLGAGNESTLELTSQNVGLVWILLESYYTLSIIKYLRTTLRPAACT